MHNNHDQEFELHIPPQQKSLQIQTNMDFCPKIKTDPSFYTVMEQFYSVDRTHLHYKCSFTV